MRGCPVILVNLHRPERRAAIAFRAVGRFFRRAHPEEVERIDRRVARYVLCGQHGYVENFRDVCPECGGYAERRVNEVMRKRLTRARTAARKSISEAKKRRSSAA